MKELDAYSQFEQMLSGWFPDADFEELSDQEIVGEYVRTVGRDEARTVINQAENLLDADPFPVEEIMDAANLHLGDEDAVREWLEQIIIYLKEENGIR